MTQTYEAIVLGLGAMGSATVYQLAQRGTRVLGIDQNTPPHTQGSSHGDTRITRLANGEGEEYVPLALRSHELWRDLLTITGGLVLVSQSSHSLHGASSFLQTTLASAEQFGIAHEVLDTAQIRQRFPQLQLVGDEQGYYEHHAGIVRPERCIEAQLALAHQHGAVQHTNERVLDYRPTSTGVEVTTPQGTYTAGKLVLCGGPWMPQLLEPALAHCFTIYRQVHYWFAARDIDLFLPGRFPIIFWGQEQTCLFVFPALAGADGGVKVSTEQLNASRYMMRRGDTIRGEVWKIEDRKKEMTAPITLLPLDEPTRLHRACMNQNQDRLDIPDVRPFGRNPVSTDKGPNKERESRSMIPLSYSYASNNSLSRNACRRPPRLGWSALRDIGLSSRSGG